MDENANKPRQQTKMTGIRQKRGSFSLESIQETSISSKRMAGLIQGMQNTITELLQLQNTITELLQCTSKLICNMNLGNDGDSIRTRLKRSIEQMYKIEENALHVSIWIRSRAIGKILKLYCIPNFSYAEN